MNAKGSRVWQAGAVAALVLLGCGVARAQNGQYPSAQQPANQTKEKAPVVAPLTLEAAAPVSAEEDAAFKAFQAVPLTDSEKKVQAGEAFAQKYTQSRYLSAVYSGLVMSYAQLGQEDKLEAIGDKEAELNPQDVQTLAIVASAIPRSINAGTVEPKKKLEKAEQYAKKAIETTPTISKPDGLSEENFTKAKDQTLAMAHAGLGTVQFRRGNFSDAVKELDLAVKLDPSPDPVNYFLLGISNEKASHFDDAAAAFAKCAAMPSSLQATCKSDIDEAKKLATTQLSAPK
jgi:tetratricopeptide (TPR) repeat protein